MQFMSGKNQSTKEKIVVIHNLINYKNSTICGHFKNLNNIFAVPSFN